MTNWVLVLDDYHLITAEPVHEAVTFLLDHLPPSMHLILLTRADPPLALARMRARGPSSPRSERPICGSRRKKQPHF